MGYMGDLDKNAGKTKDKYKGEYKGKEFTVYAFSPEDAKQQIAHKIQGMKYEENPSSTLSKIAAGVVGNPLQGATWGFSDALLNKIPGYKKAKEQFDYENTDTGLSTALDFGGALLSGGVMNKVLRGAGGVIASKVPGVKQAAQTASKKIGKVGNWIVDKILKPQAAAAGHVKMREQGDKVSGNRDYSLTDKEWLQTMFIAPMAQAAGRVLGKTINANKNRGEHKYANTKAMVGESAFEQAKAGESTLSELNDVGVQRTLKHIAADPKVNDQIRALATEMRKDTSGKAMKAHKDLYANVRNADEEIAKYSKLSKDNYKALDAKWGDKGEVSKESLKDINTKVSPRVREEAKEQLNRFTGYDKLTPGSYKRLMKEAQIIKDMSDTHMNQGKKHLATDLKEQADSIRRKLGIEDPTYVKAGEAHSTMKKLEEAKAKGRTTSDITNELLGEIAQMDDGQRNAFLHGLSETQMNLILGSNAGDWEGAVNVRSRAFNNKQLAILDKMLGNEHVQKSVKPLVRHVNTVKNLEGSMRYSAGDKNAGNEVHGFVRMKKRPENYAAQKFDTMIDSSNHLSPQQLYKLLRTPHNQIDDFMTGLKSESGKARSLNRAAGAGAVKGMASNKPRKALLKWAAPAVKKALGYDLM